MKPFLIFTFALILSGPALAEPLRLMSYNIKHGQGMDGKIDLARIAKVIAAQKPDLIALQEVDKNCTRSGNVDQAAELGRLLNMQHAFGKFMDFQGGEYGMAVLSRLPVMVETRHQLPAGAEPRCALEGVVRLGDDQPPLSFVGIHNDWTKTALRVPQVQTLLDAFADRKNPVVLVGDFNAPRDDASMKLLGPDWTIVKKSGDTNTFPSVKPNKEIDYFVVRGWPGKIGECVVIDEQLASDHRPLVLTLTR